MNILYPFMLHSFYCKCSFDTTTNVQLHWLRKYLMANAFWPLSGHHLCHFYNYKTMTFGTLNLPVYLKSLYFENKVHHIFYILMVLEKLFNTDAIKY